jgi:cytochrome c553
MNRRLFVCVVMSCFLAKTAIADATDAGSAARGKELSSYCSGCHGEQGIAPLPENPNLAGQNSAYIQYALKAYRSGERQGGKAFIMKANAGGLSDRDIADLAAFFSSLPGRQP